MSEQDKDLVDTFSQSNEEICSEDDIIDLSAFNFNDIYTWLYEPPTSSRISKVQDLDAWLRSDPKFNLPNNNFMDAHKNYVDTRTFTRPKKRVGRSILESLNETIVPSTSSIEESYSSRNFHIKEDDITGAPTNPEDSIPLMLKTANSSKTLDYNFRSSGPASIETFLNLSRSNGIDSFINLKEPEFCDILMNISQPSLMDSSILSLKDMTITNDEQMFDVTYNHISMTEEDIETNHARQNLDTTFNVKSDSPSDEVPIANKYNTYKKNALSNHLKSYERDSVDRKYYTFTKRSPDVQAEEQEQEEEEQEEQGEEEIETVEKEEAEDLPNNTESVQFDMNATFCTNHLPDGTSSREQQKRHALSKLPQYFQKSNPNLISHSLKQDKECSSNPSRLSCYNNSVGFNKGSHPNIKSIQAPRVNKMYSLGKTKFGSDQKLSEISRNTSILQTTITIGSTESIESTQSAHSTPDLDDRLSVCSDGSQSSCGMQTISIDRYHNVGRNKKGLESSSIRKPIKNILENTWIVEEKDLPSPITKAEVKDSDKTQHFSSESVCIPGMSASSPLSSKGSSQNMNEIADDSKKVNTNEVLNATFKKPEIVNKPPTMKTEVKSGLKPRTNWSGIRKIPTPVSGIPRPAVSRIPAPRFSRPSSKLPQGDSKTQRT